MQFTAFSNSILAFNSIAESDPKSPLFAIDLNASWYLQVHGTILYALSEVEEGSVNSFDLSESISNQLPPKLVSSRPVAGSPAHLCLSPIRGLLGLASYSGGLVTFFKCDPTTGMIGDLILKKVFKGNGPNRHRQESSHPHEIVFSSTDSMIYVPDLGTDEVHRFDADDLSREIAPIKITPGYGPRHLKIVGNLMLIVCELVSKLMIMKNEEVIAEHDLIDSLSRAETLDMIGTAAEIQIWNENIYVSQRMKCENGFLVHFKLNEKNGSVTLTNRYQLSGKSPRHFDIHDNQVFVALEDQLFVEIFQINLDGSLKTPSTKASVGEGQKCVAFLK